MRRCGAALAALALVLATRAPALADGPPPPPGPEVVRLDERARADYLKNHPGERAEPRWRRARPTDLAFDWTELGVATAVRFQGQTGSCWAHAAVEALEAAWQIRNGTRPVLAVEPVRDHTGRPRGAPMAVAFDDLLRRGTALEKDYPLAPGAPGPVRPVPTLYRAVAWGYLSGPGEIPAAEELKRALVRHGPLAVNLYADDAFQKYRGGVLRGSGPFQGINHSVLLVGWDDARGAWKVKNSYGTRWGEKGFAWVAYGSHNLGRDASWVRAQSTRYPPPADFAKLVPGARPLTRWNPPVAVASGKGGGNAAPPARTSSARRAGSGAKGNVTVAGRG
jgi:cathepsin L